MFFALWFIAVKFYLIKLAENYYVREWAWNEGGPWEQAVGGVLTTTTNQLVAYGSTSTLHTPEPATMLLLGSGLIGLGWFGRRRTKKG